MLMRKLLLYALLLSSLLVGCTQTPMGSNNQGVDFAGTADSVNKGNATIIVIPTTTDAPTEASDSDTSNSGTLTSDTIQIDPTEPPTDSYADGVPVPEKPK